MANEPIKVLVVDDEPNIRDLLTTSLRFNGYSVYAVGNGNDAVVAAEKGKPDIILLDVMLPDQSGFAVTKKLRSMGIDVPVLFLTARDETEDKVTGLTVGGDDLDAEGKRLLVHRRQLAGLQGPASGGQVYLATGALLEGRVEGRPGLRDLVLIVLVHLGELVEFLIEAVVVEVGFWAFLFEGNVGGFGFEDWVLRHFDIDHLAEFEDGGLQNIQALLQLRGEPLLLAEVLGQ